MTSEEKYISNRMRKANPFKVPDGYFEKFATQLMEQLPASPVQERQLQVAKVRPTIVRRLRPLYYVAASFAVALFGVAVYLHSVEPVEDHALAIAQESIYGDSYMDEAADYLMVDNYDIYACLAANE